MKTSKPKKWSSRPYEDDNLPKLVKHLKSRGLQVKPIAKDSPFVKLITEAAK